MKVVIAGGFNEAEFIISMFASRENDIVVINPSKEIASTIMKRTQIPVYVGDPSKRLDLEQANAHDADIFVALSNVDTDNYAACVLAKECFNARKCICVVQNPKNVEVYKFLGIDSVVSSTYLLGQTIKNESSVEDIIKSFSIENDKIVLVEALVLSKYKIASKMLKDIGFPKYASIACIYRTPEIIIPKGDTIIRPKDKLLIVCAPSDEKKILAFIRAEA